MNNLRLFLFGAVWFIVTALVGCNSIDDHTKKHHKNSVYYCPNGYYGYMGDDGFWYYYVLLGSSNNYSYYPKGYSSYNSPEIVNRPSSGGALPYQSVSELAKSYTSQDFAKFVSQNPKDTWTKGDKVTPEEKEEVEKEEPVGEEETTENDTTESESSPETEPTTESSSDESSSSSSSED